MRTTASRRPAPPAALVEGAAADLPNQRLAARPGFWRRLGRALVAWAQVLLYRRLLQTRLEGLEHVPAEGGFLVAANHASHLDAGLIKMALGARGSQLRALAAQDYFFAQAWSRWYFENFTNVLPFERNGGFRASLKRARTIVASGMPLLIFPEGTRSMTGRMSPFKPAIASMALAAQCAILPIYLSGTYRALPKGKGLLRSRRVGARVGRPLSPRLLAMLTDGLSRHEAYARATAAVEVAVHALARGKVLSDDDLVEALVKAEKKAEARARIEDDQADCLEGIG